MVQGSKIDFLFLVANKLWTITLYHAIHILYQKSPFPVKKSLQSYHYCKDFHCFDLINYAETLRPVLSAHTTRRTIILSAAERYFDKEHSFAEV